MILGSISVGMVWGWLLVLVWRDLPGKRPIRSGIAIFFSTCLVSVQLLLYTNWQHLLIFLVSAVIAFSIHTAWRYRLHQQDEH